MNPQISALDVPDPETRDSPLAWENDEDTDTLRESVPGERFCCFNGQAFHNGAIAALACTADNAPPGRRPVRAWTAGLIAAR